VRDRVRRIVVSQCELRRYALKAIFLGKVEGATRSHRIRAMLELDLLPSQSDPRKLIDRCVETGKYRVSLGLSFAYFGSLFFKVFSLLG